MARLIKRSWIKLWIEECLTGTIRFDLTPEERSVWYDLLLLAGRMREPGLISQDGHVPYPLLYIAGVLNIPESLLSQSLQKLQATERVNINETGIKITNWEKYQSEYARQKKYRRKEVGHDPTKYAKGRYGHMVKQ